MRDRFPEAAEAMSANDADEVMRALEVEFGMIDPNDWGVLSTGDETPLGDNIAGK